ncbi:Rne/Rng family ribonuclease [Gorillibacterium massiliense]|uniref:Rne/Rng family ribonuclease n=1 Tax=Gorillibacterium massiliense TaxID=1280390 RepID=UPI0004BA04AF|nr:Rne/Rng family ribonuclease [Gorillibacterium massiliense]
MNQIVVECKNGWSRVAILENGRLAEFYMEGPEEHERAGNVYKGRVVNVLKGMQAAFIDIGMGKNAFLYRDDLLPLYLYAHAEDKPCISTLLHVGQTLLVQIKKESIGAKGARVTTHFAIPGRWLVYMPEAGYTAVSRKISAAEDRARLKALGDELRDPRDGIILRTAAEGAGEEALRRDWELLRDLWRSALSYADEVDAPSLVYRDLDLIPRLVRDLFTERVDEMIIDDAELAAELVRLLSGMSPELAVRIRVHTDNVPLFQAYSVLSQLETAYKRKVFFPSGGYLVIDQAEAMTVIDVNTGRYTGGDDLEMTVFETNLEAAEEIAHLLRLRDIGGIIVIDFIDMRMEEHRHEVQKRLGEAIQGDRSRAFLVGWTKLGLFEMTRKKKRKALEVRLYETCSSCGGSGKTHSRFSI